MSFMNHNTTRDFLYGWVDGVWASAAQRRLALFLIVMTILFFVVLPVLPMLKGWYWPLTHETYRYAILASHFTEAFNEGVLYPRWLPDIMGGYGLPVFVFYQPGFFFLALPFELLFGHPMVTSGMALLAMLSIGGMGAYRMCRRFGGPALGLLGTCLFLLTPYIYLDVAVRGAWSELLACMFLPWVIFFLIGLREDAIAGKMPLLSVGGLGLGLAMVVISHPVVAIFCAIMMCVLAAGLVAELWQKKQFYLYF